MSRLAPRIPARARSKGDVQADVNPDVARPFFYVAARPDGSKKWGIKRVTGPRQLTDQLRRERLVPLNSWGLPGMGGSVSGSEASSKDQAELHTQLAQLLTRGVPLVEALEVTASAVSPSMRARVTRMKDLVAAGSSFADACQTVGGLDRVTIAVYRAAERTGDLGGAAKQLSITLRRQLAVAGKALTLMLYPAIVLSISCIVGIGMMTLIVPRIVESIKDVAPDMPWFTMAVYHVGITLRDYFPFFLLAVVGLVALGFVFRGVLAQVMGHIMRTTPLLRDVVLAQESTRFFTVMSAMTKSGVVLADALGVAEGAVGHPELKGQLVRLRTRLVEGGVLRQLLDEVTALPLSTRRLLIAAERSGDLQQAFDTLAADMAEEVERRSSRLLAVLEPALITMMFFMIGSLVLAVMIPLITLSSRVQT